jgi:hypothetical protein
VFVLPAAHLSRKHARITRNISGQLLMINGGLPHRFSFKLAFESEWVLLLLFGAAIAGVGAKRIANQHHN